jgi:hypothetical protein
MYFWFYFFCNPTRLWFFLHCRLAHTADYYLFLQCTWESCCNQRAPYVAN